MNFNNLSNMINESLVEDVVSPSMSYAKWKIENPELAKGKSPYYHYKKSMRGGETPVAKPISAKVEDNEIDPIAQDMVDSYVERNPEATAEDVQSHLQGLNQEPGTKTFNYSLDKAQKMLNLAKGEEFTSPVEPSPEDIAKEKPGKPIPFSELSKLLKMKASERLKYLSRKKGTGVKDVEDSEDEDENDKNNIDPDVLKYADMLKRQANIPRKYETPDDEEEDAYKTRED